MSKVSRPAASSVSAIKPQAIVTVLALIIFIDMMGIGLIIPVMPELLVSLTGLTVAQSAEIGGQLLFAYALMQFLFSPVIGGLSDRFGRRPVLLITLTLLGLDYAIMAWAPTLAWLFFGRILSGIMGASWAAANSCIADIIDRNERGKYFGILGGAGAMGFVVGPAIGGIVGEYGTRLPFIVAALLALAGAGAGFFMLHETLPYERRRNFSPSRANPFGSLIQMSRTPLVLGFLSVIFLLQLAAQSQLSIWSYYAIEKFQWSKLDIGLSVALFGILLAIVQGALTGIAITRFGEKRLPIISMIISVPAYLIFAFATDGWMMIAGVIVGAASGFAFPAMQQMMTERIDDDAQGELQGAIASTISITSIIGPVVMTSILSAYADRTGLYFPGAPFIVSTLLGFGAIIIYSVTVNRYYVRKSYSA
ncbi:MAG: TCR/Tet family MFS transporter [Pseudomonadota bacterium]